MSRQKFLISLAVLVTAAGRLSASVTTYTDRATMEAAVPLLTFANIAFDGVITGDGTFSGGLTDATTNTHFFGTCVCTGVANIAIATVANWTPSPALRETTTNEQIHVVLPSNVFAFGLDLLLVQGSSAQYEIDLTDSTGHSFTTAFAPTLPSSIFFGARSDQAIVSADIYSLFTGNQIGIDNFDLGTQAAETPEIATLLLMAAGLFTLRCLRRWMPPSL